ncbi:MAG: hypothetical protein LBG11_03150, partial [Bifidobacteriaceae bacterium]|nr:hypothetical protein [Bifidobacteriaceae bacterium]
MLRCFLATLLITLSKWALNARVFPSFDSIMPEIRDISTLFSAVALVTLAFVAYNASWIIHERPMTAAAVGGIILGPGLTALGVAEHSAWTVLLGSCLSAFSGSWALLMCALAYVSLRPDLRVYCIVGGFAASYLIAPLLPRWTHFGFAFLAVASAAAVLLIRRYTLPTFKAVAENEPP